MPKRNFEVDGTLVTVNGPEIPVKEIRAYIRALREEYPKEEVAELTLKALPGDQMSMDYTMRPPQFERIRRITGRDAGKQEQTLLWRFPYVGASIRPRNKTMRKEVSGE